MLNLNSYAAKVIALTNLMFLPCVVLADMAWGSPKVIFAAACAFTISASAAFVAKAALMFTREHWARQNLQPG